MTQQSGNQFDDLTVGNENDGSFSTESIDLFEFSGAEESPIARLKSIILSIDWEINDDILQQLDDELVDLGEIWADDKIKQVYIQGLNKIGKYIYKEKASAHPNSIKLLLTFYHNLEKIVTSDELMSEEEKKDILLADVQKFDQLKTQIGKTTKAVKPPPAKPPVSAQDSSSEPLKDLKALVLGLDWEITDEGLQKLQDEVKRLEGVFQESKAKRILLQGIGAVSAYINKMRSQSNSKSFPLLRSFCDALEKITLTGLATEEEKELLLSEVGKFNAFKVEIAKAPSQDERQPAAESPPASQSLPADTSPKTKKDMQAASLPIDHSDDEEQVASDVSARLASVFGAVEEPNAVDATDKDIALEGVNIETEADDDSDEDALPYENGAVAPALSDAEEESSFSVEKLAGDLAGDVEEESVESDAESDPVLPGVDVESEADDDSDEDALPVLDGEIAPALSGSFDDQKSENSAESSPSEDLDNRLDSFFNDEVESSLNEWGAGSEVDDDTEKGPAAALSDEVGEEGDLAAAISDEDDEEMLFAEEPEGEDEDIMTDAPAAESVVDDVEEQLSMFDEEEGADDSESITSLSLEPPKGAAEDDDEQDVSEQVFPTPEFKDDKLPEESPAAMTEEADIEDSFSSEELLADDDDVDIVTEQEDESEVEPALQFSSEEELFSESEEDDDQEAEKAEAEDNEEPDLSAPDESSLSFLDDEIGEEEGKDLTDPDSEVEEITAAEETPETEDIDELFDSEDIEFTIPGEETAVTASEEEMEKETVLDDVNEFKIADEYAGEATSSKQTGVVFEAVSDDEEVDLLPGEAYLDSEEGVLSAPIAQQEETGLSAPVADPMGGSDGDAVEVYDTLELCIESYKGESSQDTLDGLLSEVNGLRGSGDSSYTSKIYLQLMSTVCQQCECNPSAITTENSSLMDEILVGLKMNSDAEVTFEQGQEQLLRCTSQVLLLHKQEVQTAPDVMGQDIEEISQEAPDGSSIDKLQSSLTLQGSTEKNAEESLKAFVQGELADIRKIFIDEISSLRKEFRE